MLYMLSFYCYCIMLCVKHYCKTWLVCHKLVIVFNILYIIATYIGWETDLNKSLGLLSESQFVSSVQMIVYVFTCLYVKSLSDKNMFKLIGNYWTLIRHLTRQTDIQLQYARIFFKDREMSIKEIPSITWLVVPVYSILNRLLCFKTMSNMMWLTLQIMTILAH